MYPPQDVVPIVQEIADILTARDQTVAVSEAACGGLLSSYLVTVPRASNFFVGGTTTYSLRSRLKLSGWSQQDIDSYTGPSEAVATRLARNLKLELGATYALAETGWAGPNAGFDGSVGTVYFGLSGPGISLSTTEHTDSTERARNMELFALLALKFFLAKLKEKQ